MTKMPKKYINAKKVYFSLTFAYIYTNIFIFLNIRRNKIHMMKDMKKYLAEMLGTAFLVAMSVGAVVWGGMLLGSAFMGIPGAEDGMPFATAAHALIGSLAFGLSLMAIIYIIGPISGAHVNPAVSLAMFMRKKLSLKDFGFYVVAQVIGAIVGALFVWGTIKLAFGGDVTWLTAGVNGFEEIGTNTATSIILGLLVEIVLTFVFVLTIIGVVARKKNAVIAGIVIGLTLALVHFVGFNITGTSVNPARSLGTAVFGGVEGLRQVWLFLVAPMIGAALAALAGCYFFGKKEEEEAEAE